MRCLAKAQGDRYQRGNDLADALIAWLKDASAPVETRVSWLSRASGSFSIPVPTL
jgi:dsDNA-binding SOS-regulon protein